MLYAISKEKRMATQWRYPLLQNKKVAELFTFAKTGKDTLPLTIFAKLKQ